MAFLTTYHFMLPNQREIRFVVIETFRFHLIPFLRRMAIATIQLEILSMRRLHGKAAKGQKQRGHKD